jgi:hypothetical protein
MSERSLANRTLSIIQHQIQPLLADVTPVAKQELEEMLGYDAAAGVCAHGNG